MKVAGDVFPASIASGVKVAVGAVVPTGVSVGGRNVAVMTIGSGVNGGKGFSGVLGLAVMMATKPIMPIVPNKNTTVNRFAMILLPLEAGLGAVGAGRAIGVGTCAGAIGAAGSGAGASIADGSD